MTSDSGTPLGRRRGPLFRLPRVVGVDIRRSDAVPRKLRNFKSAVVRRTDGVDIVVRTDRPIPPRALGPALFVGSTVLTEVDEIAPNTYRFTNFGPQELSEDAPIRLGWTGQPVGDTQGALFRYRHPDSNNPEQVERWPASET